jgi:antagonist of KipI
MDPWSHRLANALVGNDVTAATLEMTLVGPEIEFDDERLVAVAGAEFELSVDGRRQAMTTTFTVAAGSRLRIGARGSGARGYLGLAGGVGVSKILGSRSTHLVSRLGGLSGRALSAGDEIPLEPVGEAPIPVGVVAPARLPVPGEETRIRVLAGPHEDRFSADALDVLQSAAYRVGTDSDRMGFRLVGPRLTHHGPADIISDATPLGVLQVPASGQPVLLMADRQTTGGYPTLATVISADIGLAGQLAPGDRIRFDLATAQEALAALIRQERLLLPIERSATS